VLSIFLIASLISFSLLNSEDTNKLLFEYFGYFSWETPPNPYFGTLTGHIEALLLSKEGFFKFCTFAIFELS